MLCWPAVTIGLVLTISHVAASEFSSAPEDQAKTPNILLIVLDDFGFNDLGANGNPRTPTPNLDAFAAQGIRYTRHYADATCSVARAALMTGRFPATHGLRPSHLGLSKDTPTIASVLSDAGYLTQHTGKWHIAVATLEQSPSELGFDNWFGFLHQNELQGASADGIRYLHPTYRNPWLRDNQSVPTQYQGHLTNILTDRAVDFLDQQKLRSQPWFLNLWYYAPHSPIEPDTHFSKKYPATKEGEYYALIDQLDSNIGRVLDTLDHNGQADNTLVIVLSDNGGTNAAVDSNAPYYGKKTQFYEGGVRTPLLMRWPSHIEPNTVTNEIVSILDIFPTIAQNTSAIPPSDLIGRDLLDAGRAPPPQLFWEYSDSVSHRYSVLSVDGHWRLRGGTWVRPTLNNLAADPSGQHDVINLHPDIAARLKSDYLQWRMAAREVDFTYQPLNNRGAAILRGNDLQRSPGRSGFTFAIGVTPPSKIVGKPQVIVKQSNRWQILMSAQQGLSIEILGEKIEGPRLPAGQCTELVISSHFKISPFQWKQNLAIIDIYLNGQIVNHVRTEMPTPKDLDYNNSTYIGIDPDGKQPFLGELSRPIILNERVVPDNESEIIDNGISDVLSTCPPKGVINQVG